MSLKDPQLLPDPLPVPIFSEILPYYCVPMCGVYGFEDYYISDPIVLIVLSGTPVYNEEGLHHQLPDDIQHCLKQHCPNSSEDILVTFIIHSLPSFEFGLEPEIKQVNIMHHIWAFKNLSQEEQLDPHVIIKMGIFSPFGVSEASQDATEELNGAPIGSLGPRIQYMHNSSSLSPHNCHIELSKACNIHSFYSLAIDNDKRLALSYHVIPSNEVVADSLLEVIGSVQSVGDLLINLHTLCEKLSELSLPVTILKSLLQAI